MDTNATGMGLPLVPSPQRPGKSAWQVYRRLLGMALVYRGRLVVSVILAIFIAASFGAMLVGVGTVIRLTFYQPGIAPASTDQTQEKSPRHEDPALSMARDIANYNQAIRNFTGWAPPNLDTKFLDLVRKMRENRMRAVALAAVIVVVLAFLVGVARFFQEFLATSVGARVITDLARQMYENLTRQSLDFVEGRPSGEILARFNNDIFLVSRGLEGVFVKLLREPFKVLVFLGVALRIDWELTVVGVCVMPMVLYTLVYIGKKMRKSVRRSLQKIASMTSVVNETVRGMAIIKAYTMEARQIARVDEELTRLRRFLYQMARLQAATGPVTEFILILGVAGFVLFSARRVEAGILDAGDLVQLYFALGMMLDPVRKMSDVNNLVQTSVASAERCFEMVDAEPNIQEAPDAVDAPPLREALRFERVSFSYIPGITVLDDLTLDFPRGSVTAIVGYSGSGKTTLAKLIPRFYDVSDGAITLDGVDIRRLTFRGLREQIGLVTQDTFLFAGTVRDNIAFGRRDFSDEQIRAAARAANAEGFILALPDGYDTIIGEQGATLSGGQRQRLAIARAIIKDPAILILDEATSNLDSESERLIQDALDRFMKGRTTIVIAHRLSTIRRADRIVVLDSGRIAEMGDHDTLLARNGLYRRLYETQFYTEGEA
ncbi:MAG: ABC transporter ATP-binding protein [Candidatus Hydrogenedentes bacterium]|nr:ABC transporter ATP-binding protein [Candidatus Hydrogenedentota bacterium]